MSQLAILTPIKDGQEFTLRDHLRGLGTPFAGREMHTHFARFVVVDTGKPHLLFSSKFDGGASDYLDKLAQIDEAVAIWEHCRRPAPCTKETLHRYLVQGDDRVDPSYEVDMLPTTTVASINEAIRLRAELSKLVARSLGLDPVALAHEFRQLEAIRKLMIR